MTLDQIKYFLAAAEYQHVGKAARSIPISPSAISAAIAHLENELKVKLFDRRLKRIQLTPTGYQFKTWGQDILKEIDSVKFQLSDEREEFHGKYRLGASHFLASDLLGPTWFDLQEKHPRLIGDIRSLETGVVVSDILAGRLDLGVVFTVVSHPEISQTRIHDGPMVIVVRKNHPILKARGKNRLKLLSKYPAITHKATQGVEVCEDHPLFSKIGITPKTSLYFDHDAIALSLLASSNAWALLPEFVARRKSKELAILHRPEKGEASYFIAVLRHRSQAYDPLLSKLEADLKSRVAPRGYAAED